MQVPFFWRGEVTSGIFPTLGTGTVNSPLAEATALGKQQVCMELTIWAFSPGHPAKFRDRHSPIFGGMDRRRASASGGPMMVVDVAIRGEEGEASGSHDNDSKVRVN